MIIPTIISAHLSALMRFKRQLHEVHKIDAQWRGHVCTNGTSSLRNNWKALEWTWYSVSIQSSFGCRWYLPNLLHV